MADAGPGALGQSATDIQAGARTSADSSRAAAAPDASPLKGAKLVAHGDAKANLRAQIQSELQNQGVDTSSLSDTAPAPQTVSDGPPPGALVDPGNQSAPAPDPLAASADVVPRGKSINTTPTSPSMAAAVGQSTEQLGRELGNGLMRGGLSIANALGFGVVGASRMAYAPALAMGLMTPGDQADSDAKVFDFLHKYVDTARNFWSVPANESNPYAQAVGQVAETAAPMLLGPEGAPPAMMASAAFDQGKDVIDQRAAETAHQLTLDAMSNGTYDAQARREGAGASQGVPEGDDVDTAIVLSLLAAGSTGLQMKLPLKNPAIAKRIASAVGLGLPLNAATETATKLILKNRGFQTAADKIDPTDPTTVIKSGLMQTIFGILGDPGNAKKIEDTRRPPGSAARVEPYIGDNSGTPPPPPAPFESNDQTTGITVGPNPPGGVQNPASAPVAQVPDTPSAEPVSDLRAQFKDMGNSATPRNAVFVSTANADNLKGAGDVNKTAITNQIARAAKEGRVVDTGNGQLIVKSKALAADATARLKGGEDPQSVIGDLTGAGTGKRPDQTHVVQGVDTKGNVVTEGSVAPQETAAKVEAAKNQGLEPVVTTPEEAVARRADLVASENQGKARMESPRDEDRPAERFVGADGATYDVVHNQDGNAKVTRTRGGDEAITEDAREKADAAKGIFGLQKGNWTKWMSPEELAALKEKSGAPAEAVPTARPAEGEVAPPEPTPEVKPPPAEPVTKVANDSAGTERQTSEAPPEAPPAAKPIKKAAKPTTGMDALPKALVTHEVLDTPRNGKKFAAGLEDRKENAANFGMVLEQAAKEKAADMPEQAARALEVAKKMTAWSDMSENAVVKGQGISHTTIDAIVKEAHSAARELMGKGTEADKPTGLKVAEIRAKAETKARQEKAKAKPAAAVKKASKPSKPPIGRVPPEVRTKMAKFTEEFREADTDKEAADKRNEIEQWMNEQAEEDDRFTPDQINSVMHWLDTEREANQAGREKPATMGDTVESTGESVVDQEDLAGKSSIIHRALSAVRFLGESASEKLRSIQSRAAVARLQDEWSALTKLHMSPGTPLHDLLTQRDTGTYASSHDLLKAVIGHPDSAKVAPHVANLLQKLAHVAPDVPVFARSVGNVVSSRGTDKFSRADYSGLAVATRDADRGDLKNMTTEQRAERMAQHVQLAGSPFFREGQPHAFQTLFHEMWHTATAYELNNNPTGQFANEMENAYAALRERMGSKYGEDVINDHVAYFNGGAEKPVDYMRHLYGLTDAKEMVSEIWTNPKFLSEVIDSESFAGGKADAALNMTAPKTSLLERIFSAIGKLFGGMDPKLMKHIMQLSMDVGADQKKHFGWFQNANADVQAQRMSASWKKELSVNEGVTPLEQARAAAGLRNISEPAQDLEPKWLETEINAAIRPDTREANDPDPSKPDTIIGATRNWMHITAGKSLGALRTTKMWLKSYDQIMRDHVKDFGADQPSNPLRELQNVNENKEVIMNRLRNVARGASKAWAALTPDESLSVSKVMRDSTLWGIDPRLDKDEQSLGAKANKGFDSMFDQITNSYSKLGDHVKNVYDSVTDTNAKLQDERRKAGIDTALATFDSSAVADADKQALYAVRHPSEYERLIGPGKRIDLGEDNEKFHEALKDFSASQEIDGPYHHLGRQGEFVVQPEPTGSKGFETKAEAEKFADTARSMSPDSTAKVVERGGQFHVDYEIQYTSMHDTEFEATAEKNKLNAAGFDTGNVTRKTTDKQNAPLSYGMKELLAEAERKLQKGADDPKEIEAQVAALRSSFLQIQAARSAYAGSRLARRNFGGVLAKDMRKNFSDHTMSTIWHISQMKTVFDEAKAMAAMRTSARDRTAASQAQGLRRGEVAKILNARALDEVANMGNKSALNTVLAKLAYYRYLASPAHAAIWMTQNPTAGMAIGGAKWGYGRTALSVARTGALAVGPAMRATMREAFRKGGSSDMIHAAVLAQVAKSARYAKFVPQLTAMMERGVISHNYADEMAKLQQSSGSTRIGAATDFALQWARMMPSMADAVNRMSSALTGLELTGGDVRQATDYVNQTHADYSSANKPLLFKKIARVPGGNTVTAFLTYQQNMMHLIYGNIASAISGRGNGGRMQASKTVAGLMVANSIFAGVYSGSAIIPVQLAAYAYNKLQKEGEVFDLQTGIHHFLVDHFGESLGTAMADGPIAHGLGINLSSRMGIADLFFRDMPDLLSSDLGAWKDFLFDHSGTFIEDMANSTTQSAAAMGNGDIMGALSPWIPFKIYQDSVKAAGLWNEGKRNGYGSQLTEPSKLDAIKQIVGFKPESVANAQDTARITHLYSAAHASVRDSLSKQFASAADGSPEQADVSKRIDAYNTRNPSNPITSRDLLSTEKYKARVESGVIKDQRAKAATTF